MACPRDADADGDGAADVDGDGLGEPDVDGSGAASMRASTTTPSLLVTSVTGFVRCSSGPQPSSSNEPLSRWARNVKRLLAAPGSGDVARWVSSRSRSSRSGPTPT